MTYEIVIYPDSTPGKWIVGLKIQGAHTNTSEFIGLDSIDAVTIKVSELMQTSEILRHPTMYNE